LYFQEAWQWKKIIIGFAGGLSMKKNPGERTLLLSVVLSSPGPIVLGIGLFIGNSSTQLADFIRRTAELIAIIVSWAVYRITHNVMEYDANHRFRLERIANNCVGIAMCLGGIAMLLVALLHPSEEKGNVIPGMIIAILGVITNSWFWIRYRKLNKANPNSILAAQNSLYRAKTLVDICVTIALITVAVSPGSQAAYFMDMAGSAVVAVYLLINGAVMIFSKKIAKYLFAR
jgi:divalent metal cation (Fe/Co/Zn/Cd) transporter